LDLETILSPVTIPDFLDQYFGQAFLRVPGSHGKFAGLNCDETACSLEQELEAPIRMHNHSGVALARQEQDGILLQIAGDGECKVYGNFQEVADPAVWVGLLKEGDALYIPRGWWLGVAPSGSQVGFAIQNPTGADLLDWVVKHIKQLEAFQTDIPRFGDLATKADYAAGLRKAMAGVFRRPALFEAWRRETNLTAPPQHGSKIPWSASASGDHLIAILAPRKIRIKRADAGTILLVAMGKRLAFPEEAAAMLHYLADRAPVTLLEFYKTFEGEFDRDELSDFLSVLSKDGIIGLREPHSI
jgi:hypothetical protein